jgi:DNA-binding transcriptional MerR regulator
MSRTKTAYRIGDLAAAAGVTVDTLRYYEREGLLPPVDRTAGGFRCYSEDTAHRLEFIKQARELGMSLREIRQLVDPGNARCATVRQLLIDRLADVDNRMRDLAAFRKTLKTALERCEETLDRSKTASCPVAGELGT